MKIAKSDGPPGDRKSSKYMEVYQAVLAINPGEWIKIEFGTREEARGKRNAIKYYVDKKMGIPIRLVRRMETLYILRLDDSETNKSSVGSKHKAR